MRTIHDSDPVMSCRQMRQLCRLAQEAESWAASVYPDQEIYETQILADGSVAMLLSGQGVVIYHPSAESGVSRVA